MSRSPFADRHYVLLLYACYCKSLSGPSTVFMPLNIGQIEHSKIFAKVLFSSLAIRYRWLQPSIENNGVFRHMPTQLKDDAIQFLSDLHETSSVPAPAAEVMSSDESHGRRVF